jgi:hypothetical protein
MQHAVSGHDLGRSKEKGSAKGSVIKTLRTLPRKLNVVFSFIQDKRASLTCTVKVKPNESLNLLLAIGEDSKEYQFHAGRH